MNSLYKGNLLGFAIGILLFILQGCSADMLLEISRTSEDPEVVSPTVTSFKVENTITISWEEDAAADEYILYYAEDAESPNYTVLYRGTDLSYTLNNQTDQDIFLFRLSKIRGSKEFGPSNPVMGVVSNSIVDFQEPNNSKDQATLLEYEITANTYFYQSYDLQSLKDIDWYYVVVPAQRTMTIVFTNGDAENFVTSGDLYFSWEGQSPVTVVPTDSVQMENSTLSDATYRFQIFPAEDAFLEDMDRNGGAMRNYILTVAVIQ